MPETFTIQYPLTRDLWRRFFEAHYSRDKSLKLRHLWGATCIVVACLGFGGFYASKPIAALLLVTGFYGVLSKQMLILKSLRTASRHPFFDKELTLTVTSDELSVRSGNSGYSQPWQNFVGYRLLEPGFLLYHDANAFFFIPSEALTTGYQNQIVRYLETAKVPRWDKANAPRKA